MTLKDKVIDAIECLKSCIEDDAKSVKYFDDCNNTTMATYVTGRIDGYRKAIEMLNYILEGK